MTLQSFARHDAEIAALGPWFHNLHLPDGRQTAPDHPLGDFPAFKWRELQAGLPPDLTGWSALDIGCNAGFYSFELARRGARVTGLEHDGRYLEQARWACEQFGLTDRVAFRLGNVYELARTRDEYDLVLFMGVLYHLRHPLLALDAVARITRRLLVVQTMTMPAEPGPGPPPDMSLDDRGRLAETGWPRAAFIEHAVAGDRTNWWALDAACMEAMARSAGLVAVGRPSDETWLFRPSGQFPHAAELDSAAGRLAAKRPGEGS